MKETEQTSGGLKLVNTSPADGSDGAGSSNVLVKLYFDKDIQNAADQADKIKFTRDSDGEEVQFRIVENNRDLTNVNLLVDKGDVSSDLNNSLDAGTAYTIAVDSGFTAVDGSTLGSSNTISFSTMGADSGFAYMLLMIAMVVVMVVMSVRDQKKRAQAEMDLDPFATVPTNPYKLAKERNISLAEAQKQIEKARAKAEKKAEELRAAQQKHIEEAQREKPAGGSSSGRKVYRVKEKRPAGKFKR